MKSNENFSFFLRLYSILYDILLQAQAATLTIAQAFNLAYECWQASQERGGNRRTRKREASKGKREASSGNRREGSGNRRDTSSNRRDGSGNRRDASGSRRDASGNRRGETGSGNRKEPIGKKAATEGQSSSTLVTTEAIVERPSLEDKTTSPSSGYNSCGSGGPEEEEETFLIDLSSPGDSLDKGPPVVAARKKDNWIMFEEEEVEGQEAKKDNEEMDRGFKR